MTTETRERIERLRALDDNDLTLYEIAHACIKEYSFKLANCEFRNFIIDLLERSDPDGWTDERLSEYGLVRLPRDRDGEVINTGDVVYDDYGNRWIVKKLVFEETPTHCPVQVSNHEDNNVTLNGFMPYSLTHHPPVTVESVLRKFLSDSEDAMRKGYDEVPHEVFAEYAKRLRLAKEDE